MLMKQCFKSYLTRPTMSSRLFQPHFKEKENINPKCTNTFRVMMVLTPHQKMKHQPCNKKLQTDYSAL